MLVSPHLRHIQPSDAAQFHELVKNNRARLEDFLPGTVRKTQTLEATEDFIADALKRNAEKSYYSFVILDEDTNKIVGCIDVKNIAWDIPKAELGCFMDEAQAKKGIARKAMQEVIRYFFDELGFLKLFLRTHEGNTAARRLAESCGFEIEGTIRKDHKTTKGEIVDLLYYGLVRE